MSLSTVQFWVQRAGGKPFAQVDWTDRSCRPRRHPAQISRATQRLICRLRRQLAKDDLGFVGAASIRDALQSLLRTAVPSVRTINRILQAHGFMAAARRHRTAAPPKGWYLPVAGELDSFDFIEGLGLGEAGAFDVFTGRALFGSSRLAVIAPHWSALGVVEALVRHWRVAGLPTYAQFDNDLRFHGSRHPPGSLGRVIRLCLGLGVTPIFAPPRESGFQAAIEHFNGLWQRKVWQRFDFEDLAHVRWRSERFVTAYTDQLAQRGPADPAPRRPFPDRWRADYASPPSGQVIFLRRANAHGTAEILGHRLRLDPRWPHRLLRCTLSLPAQQLHVHRLQRRNPAVHTFVQTLPFPCCLKPIRLGRTD